MNLAFVFRFFDLQTTSPDLFQQDAVIMRNGSKFPSSKFPNFLKKFRKPNVRTFWKANELLSIEKMKFWISSMGHEDGTEHVSESSQDVSELDVCETTDIRWNALFGAKSMKSMSLFWSCAGIQRFIFIKFVYYGSSSKLIMTLKRQQRFRSTIIVTIYNELT